MDDTAMTNEEQSSISLPDYINQYSGFQKIIRLQSLINDGLNIDEKTVLDAIRLGFKIASSTNNLGMFLRI